MTVRDVRQKWPEAERCLTDEGEIIITRDGIPVVRLLPVEEQASRRRLDPEEHTKWLEDMWGDETFDSLTPLMEDRKLISDEALAEIALIDREEEKLAFIKIAES